MFVSMSEGMPARREMVVQLETGGIEKTVDATRFLKEKEREMVELGTTSVDSIALRSLVALSFSARGEHTRLSHNGSASLAH